ncbi:hypothetical protein QL285_004949 [Trifolium repens]|nr:hypothetical protein QL285_004949 [Trifolium repens]
MIQCIGYDLAKLLADDLSLLRDHFLFTTKTFKLATNKKKDKDWGSLSQSGGYCIPFGLPRTRTIMVITFGLSRTRINVIPFGLPKTRIRIIIKTIAGNMMSIMSPF